jgi:hypothetical protein
MKKIDIKNATIQELKEEIENRENRDVITHIGYLKENYYDVLYEDGVLDLGIFESEGSQEDMQKAKSDIIKMLLKHVERMKKDIDRCDSIRHKKAKKMFKINGLWYDQEKDANYEYSNFWARKHLTNIKKV